MALGKGRAIWEPRPRVFGHDTTNDHLARGSLVYVPEIADDDMRRELLRAVRTVGLRRLDDVLVQVQYLPMTTPMMPEAAALWAHMSQHGQPTAADTALNGDVILAAHARSLISPADTVVIATTNVSHLARMIAAQLWYDIT